MLAEYMEWTWVHTGFHGSVKGAATAHAGEEGKEPEAKGAERPFSRFICCRNQHRNISLQRPTYPCVLDSIPQRERLLPERLTAGVLSCPPACRPVYLQPVNHRFLVQRKQHTSKIHPYAQGSLARFSQPPKHIPIFPQVPCTH